MDATEIGRLQKKLAVLKENLNKLYSKLVIPTQDGYFFVKIEHIIYCQAQGNYTCFQLIDQEKILVSKTLKIYTTVLEEFNFFRVSRSHLININHIKKYNRSSTPSIIMVDETEITVSLTKREALLKYIHKSRT